MGVAADLSSSIWIVYDKEQKKSFKNAYPLSGLQKVQKIISDEDMLELSEWLSCPDMKTSQWC